MKQTSFLLYLLMVSFTLLAQNVGIGTTTPLAKLHVFSGASGNTTPFSPFVVEGNNNTYINLLTPNINESGILFGKADNAASGAIVYNNTNALNGFQFRNNNNITRMLIANNGNVGIGLSDPNAKLSISANGTELAGSAASNTFRTQAGILGSTAGSELSLANIGFSSTNNSSLGIRAYRNSTGTDWTTTALLLEHDVDNTARVNSTYLALGPLGNIGIGNTNPYSPLTFNNNLGEKISLWGNATNSYGLGVQSGTFQIHSDLSSADIAFGYGNSGAFTERMRIKGTGNVGIGTSNPAYQLDISNRIRIRSGGNNSISAGLWLNNNANTEAAFIGMEDDSHVGFFGVPTGFKFVMNTQTGALKINGSEGQAGQVLQSNGSGTAAAWISAATVHYIGESYGGGIVFHVYDNGQHGLIAATTDQGVGVRWSISYTITNAVRDGLDAGKFNTERIITNQGAGAYAAQICANYSGGNHGDWYLPSKYEIYLLYQQRTVVGGIANAAAYWSSSEWDSFSSYAWSQSMLNGTQSTGDKAYYANVRAVRAF